MTTTTPSRSETERPGSAGSTELDGFLAVCAREVETFLDGALPCGGALAGAVRYAVLGGGKRLRPSLAMASAMSVGGRAEDALPAGAAVEMVHSYSLIHDDLPCMDDDDLRRGQPSVHVRYGEAMAVLAGDALHTLAFGTLAESAAPPSVRLESVKRLAAAAGPAGMVGGQVLDLEAETRPPDARELESIHCAKTGALFDASAALGGLAGGGSPAQVEALSGFGMEIGLVFQIVDDLLDEEETTATLGKSAGKDRAAGKTTYPVVHGARQARAEAVRRAAAARQRLDSLGEIPDTSAGAEGRRLLHALTDRILHRHS